MESLHFNFSNFLLLFLASSLLLQFFLVNCNALGSCLHEESTSLLQLKQGFITGNLDTWKPETDCCFWDGITCDESSRVTGLDLSVRSISGIINPSLFNLTSLRTLNFSYTSFDGMPIPDFGWDKLANLSALDLSKAEFAGKVPAGVFNLSKLTYLDLSYNDDLFLTANTTFLQNMSNLRELHLDYVNMSGYGEDWCGVLAKFTPVLEVLSMGGCSLFKARCSSLSKLIFLYVVTLWNNNLDSSILDSFVNFTFLSELYVQSNGFKGFIPKQLFRLRNLEYLSVSNNKMLSGSLPDFLEGSKLKDLVLSSTNLSGNLPGTIGNLKFLRTLDLSDCQFSGGIPSSMGNLSLLQYLDFSGCQFFGRIPPSMGNLSRLQYLDLSNNSDLHGQIPRSLFQISRLISLLLHSNNFSGVVELELIKDLKKLSILSLSNNRFSLSSWDADDGSLSSSFPNITFLGLASCNLTKIPAFIKYQILALDLSNNRIHGQIPPSLCNLILLNVLDLSNNSLTGSIPQCLFEKSQLVELNLRANQLQGAMPDGISTNCLLLNINLSDNQLEGLLPRSLYNCRLLEILDLGNNKLHDTFPYWLGNISFLQALVLGSNNFYGHVGLPKENQESNYTFSNLYVLDISSNNFSGNLCIICFSSFKSMMVSNTNDFYDGFYDSYDDLINRGFYREVLTIINKGQLMMLQKSWKIFRSIDVSNNHFEGEISTTIGQLVSLQVLNMSHNYFKGIIPPQLGNLSQLVSLDLSRNELSGKIPPELASLSFMEYLNLSYNKLVGEIPSGGQFSTFSCISFEGNEGLHCPSIPRTHNKTVASPPCSPKWKSYMIVLGILFGVGVGVGMATVVMVDVMYCDRWRMRTRRHVHG